MAILDLNVFAQSVGITVKRELELQGARFLLKKLIHQPSVDLSYTESGKPFIKGCDGHISISHSNERLVVLINNKESTGIDIEYVREKVISVQSKFLNQKEQFIAGNHATTLTVFWAAKEAVYKAYGQKGVRLSDQILIEEYDHNKNIFIGVLNLPNFKKRYSLTKEILGDYVLVYVNEEIQ